MESRAFLVHYLARALLTRMQAREMIHNWDQQIVRLRHRVDELEEQNEELRDLLKDAVRICDEAIATGHRSAPPSRFANMYRFLLFHSVSLRSLLQQQWRRLLLPVSHLPLPYRRESVHPSAGRSSPYSTGRPPSALWVLHPTRSGLPLTLDRRDHPQPPFPLPTNGKGPPLRGEPSLDSYAALSGTTLSLATGHRADDLERRCTSRLRLLAGSPRRRFTQPERPVHTAMKATASRAAPRSHTGTL